ncbi:hypothetical protein KGQ19_18155 [Catenulispora sp. NL8]|uniref:C1q domain-containing protein n=1 Tax=Catenulispora pinistramenti TaxID=2705254 RepID=A0ABS5KRX2_9ACTN|nr:hypothetical protein [Catenulispora pinistramenti]MBS2548792.1 hypothetical protein [Catenulispora pinistramenti]
MTNLGIPTQRTWTDGEVVTAAMLNANVRDAVNFGINTPALIARQTAAQNINNQQWTPVTYDTVDVDPYGAHNASITSQYVAPLPGVYHVCGQCDFTSNANGFRSIRIQVNGGAQILAKLQIAPVNGVDTALSTSADVFLNAGDYVEIAVYQFSGTTIPTGAVDGQPRMTVMWEHT